MKAIEVINISKIYDDLSGRPENLALSDFSLTVDPGSIFGLLGPNGAGKSTLINILAGTVKKTSGKAFIMGVDLDEDPKLAKHKIGIVPQEIVMDTFFCVEDALEFYAGYFGIKKKDRKTKEILSALGLQNKAQSYARQLSGGMKRRFLVARAMVHFPDVLILDEPTAGVDIELREQLWDYVQKLNRQGTTIILTTHYLEEAEKLCDRIGFINNGKLVKCDSKDNLLSSLSNKKMLVKSASLIEKIPKNLASYNIEIIDNYSLQISFNKREIELKKVLDDISKSNIEISDLSISDGSLEEVFRSVYSP